MEAYLKSPNYGQRLNSGSKQAAKVVCKARKHGTTEPHETEPIEGNEVQPRRKWRR